MIHIEIPSKVEFQTADCFLQHFNNKCTTFLGFYFNLTIT